VDDVENQHAFVEHFVHDDVWKPLDEEFAGIIDAPRGDLGTA
jgi:hypothetical protein